MSTPNDHPSKTTLEGTRLGRYVVGAKLGSGGAASVHLGIGHDADAGEVVALKIIHEHLAEEQEFVNMFLDEARVAVLLVHPNIVRTHELGRDGSQLYIAMEYLDGQSLHDVFVRGTRQGARLPVDLVAWIGSCVARALHHAHTLLDADGKPMHLIHRDVSPRNIFITYDGQVKLIDFGIAHAAGRIAKTALGQMKGTFSYIAPERALGGGCDHRADQFSLATALFEASTGKRLFRGDDDVETLRNILSGKVPDPRTLRDGYPDALARILRKSLSNRPNDRYSDCAAMAEALEGFTNSCGREDPRVRLGSLMQSIFSDRMARKQDAIAGVRAIASPAQDPASDVSSVAVSSSSQRPVVRPTRKWVVVSAVAAAALLVGGLALVLTKSPPAAPAMAAGVSAPELPSSARPAASELPAPAVVANVTIELVTDPRTQASFSVAGRELSGTNVRFDHPRGDEPLDVRVRAEGFLETTVRVVPDRDRSTTVALRRVDPERPSGSAQSRGVAAGKPGKQPKQGGQSINDLLNKRY